MCLGATASLDHALGPTLHLPLDLGGLALPGCGPGAFSHRRHRLIDGDHKRAELVTDALGMGRPAPAWHRV